MKSTTEVMAARDPRLDRVLSSGWIENPPEAGGRRQAIARTWVGRPDSPDDGQVVLELFEAPVTRPPGVRPWLQAVRAYSLTATMTPCLAVLTALNGGTSVTAAVLALVGVGFLQVAINVFNDVEDYRRLIDLPDTPGGSGVIQLGWWTPEQLRRIAWLALGLGTVSGMPAVLRSPEILLPIALLAGIGTLLYSARRGGLKYHALGDVAVAVLCGPALSVGYASAIGGPIDGGVLWIGGFFGFLAMALLHVNNLQDMEVDRRRRVKTLAIVLGFRRSMRALQLLQALAMLSLVVGVVRNELPIWALGGAAVQAALALPWLRKIAPALGPDSALLEGSRMTAAQIHLLGGVGLIVGLALA